MKKTIFCVLAGLLTFAGTSNAQNKTRVAGYNLEQGGVYGSPEPVLIPRKFAPVRSLRPGNLGNWWVEASGFYGISHDPAHETAIGLGKINIGGTDLTIGRNISRENFSLNLRINYLGGSKHQFDRLTDITPNGANPYTTNSAADLSAYAIMPGLRFSEFITPDLRFCFGFNIGYTNVSLDESITDSRLGYDMQYSGDRASFVYSAEFSLQYAITDTLFVFAGYQFYGIPNGPELNRVTPNAGTNYSNSVEVDNFLYHVIRVGVILHF